MATTSDLKALLEKYRNSPRVEYTTPETKYRYLRVVESFLMWVKSPPNLKKGFPKEVLLSFLGDGHKGSPGYQRWMYHVLKGFCEECGIKWNLHPKDLPPDVEPERPYLETSEAERLLNLARPDPLDYAMFRLVLVTGIRKRELRELNLEDYKPPTLTIRTRKHGERRVRTLDVETVEAINRYVEGKRKIWGWRNKGRDAPLFLSPTGVRLPDSTLTMWFSRYMRALGKPKGCGMHSLRRTCVTWEAEGGMDVMRLQKLHGWKSPTMPEVYARLKPAKLEEEAYEANPLIKR